MEQASAGEWQSFAEKLVDAAEDAGFTGLVLPPTAPIGNFRNPADAERLAAMIEKQRFLLDQLGDRNMSAVLMPGNPLSRNWGKAGAGYPAHTLYTHPAVIAVKLGDEPDAAELPGLISRYQAIRRAYPDLPVVTIFVGETIGGPTETSDDMLETYLEWWTALDADVCAVRSYPFRSRNHPGRNRFGDYDLNTPYVPEKLAVHPEEMARLVARHCPTGRWALVAQAFGKCKSRGSECYWRFPTKKEMIEQARLGYRHDADWYIAWPLLPHREDVVALLDEEFLPELAEDGSLSLEAIRVIRACFWRNGSMAASVSAKRDCGKSPGASAGSTGNGSADP